VTLDDLTRSLTVERRQPVPTMTREQQQLADLREVIHILAMAMSEGRAVA
jgi:uncharacterized protein YoaH (UPF0181 family)